jgi:hypothetical protein
MLHHVMITNNAEELTAGEGEEEIDGLFCLCLATNSMLTTVALAVA